METHALLTTLALVAGLFAASAAKIENIESYRPIELPVLSWNKDTASSQSLASPHIVGGNEAIPHSLPHQVVLFLKAKSPKEEKNGLCGGSLISDSWVVTAAHCVDKRILFRKPEADSNKYNLTVTVGAGVHDRSKTKLENATNVQLVKASKIIINPKWNLFGIANDIAVLKLEKSVILDGKYAKSIRLPKLSQKTQTFQGSTVTFSGWGLTKPSSHEPEQKLQTADSKVVSILYCRFRYLFIFVKNTNICTSSWGRPSTCKGDSGGPLIVKEDDGEPTLVGITSFGLGCQWGFPNVFTRVTSYLDWIHETTNVAPRN